MNATALSSQELSKTHAYWRAANYLSVGQLYLCENPLLKEPLKLSHVKSMLLGHWGTTPGQNFIDVHLNRVIKKYDLNMFYVAGPGHGGPAIVGNVCLEGTWSEVYSEITQNEALDQFLFGCGWIPYYVEGDDPEKMHQLMASVTKKTFEEIKCIQKHARNNNDTTRPRSPMIVLKSPERWTGPKVVDGLQIEGTFRAHQIPLLVDAEHPGHLKLLKNWMISRVPKLGTNGARVKKIAQDKLIEHKSYIDKNGLDMPEILNWKWVHKK